MVKALRSVRGLDIFAASYNTDDSVATSISVIYSFIIGSEPFVDVVGIEGSQTCYILQ